METNYLLEEKIPKLMRKYAIPCLISLVVAAVYNIVDQLFIANAAYLGSNGNAANTIVFPLTIVALALAVLIGDGCCAYVSISLGKKEKEEANVSIGNSIVLCVIASLVLMAIYLVFEEKLIILFGGQVNLETFNFAKQYLFWIALGIPCYMFGQALNPIIRSDGNPRFAMFAMLLGAITNLILDPIFINVFKWGMEGAAIATIIGQFLTALVSFIYLFKLKNIKLNKNSFKLNSNVIKQFLKLGLTSFSAQISLVIAMAVVQNVCTKYSLQDPIFSQPEYSQIPLAVLGIVMKFFQIAISISIGIAAGCIPIAGYNIGAKAYSRVKQLLTYLLVTEALVGLVALIIVEVFPGQLISLFGASNESIYYTEFAIKSFRTYLCMLVLATVNKGTFIYLQALGKAKESTLLSLTREVIFGVTLPLVLPLFFGLDGLLYSFPVSDILTFILTTYIVIMTYKELSIDKKEQLA
ncbi:MAG: MATE family efflux transporter [Bacilli bacterium]|jgi:putative MATE family efflux protein|nr:MATE family efflux transporter [Bacilli bacterium]MDD4065611.1 MATE family efflux transporter [Bacilli bacterium]